MVDVADWSNNGTEISHCVITDKHITAKEHQKKSLQHAIKYDYRHFYTFIILYITILQHYAQENSTHLFFKLFTYNICRNILILKLLIWMVNVLKFDFILLNVYGENGNFKQNYWDHQFRKKTETLNELTYSKDIKCMVLNYL